MLARTNDALECRRCSGPLGEESLDRSWVYWCDECGGWVEMPVDCDVPPETVTAELGGGL